MPADPDGLSILCISLSLVLLFWTALHAAAEAALDCLSVSQLKKDAEAGDKRSKTLLKSLDAWQGVTSPLRCGLLFSGLLGTALWTLGLFFPFYRLFAAVKPALLHGFLAVLAAAVLYILFFTVLGDLLPKKVIRRDPRKFARSNAGLIHFLSQTGKPFLALCSHTVNGILRLCRIDPASLEDAVTEEGILQIVDESEEKGVIEETEKDMIANILDFNDTSVGEIMTHRTDITAVADDAPVGQVIEASVENGCSRIPVYHEDIDSVVGICYVKDLLPYVGRDVPDFIRLTDLMRPAYFIPETKKCSQLFTEMTERKVQIAIVVDEYGGTAGLITLEDLVESIVGNIQDEYDHEEEEIHQVSETEFTVDGTTSIDEISDLTGVSLPEGDYDTIAGLVTEQLGRIPKEGEYPKIQVGRLTITVLEVEDQRLSRLLIVKEPPEEENKERDESE